MRIQFCGADRTVTGSCHLVEIGGKRILLDCGIYQGARDVAARLNQLLPRDPKTIDAVILSHGHLDHCGKLPLLVKSGFTGPIYCTPATAAVARIVLTDSAKIQEEDAAYLNRRERAPGEAPVRALYGAADLPGTFRAMKHVAPGDADDGGAGVTLALYDAGHILGSTYITLSFTEGGRKRRLLFTADIGRYNTPILRDPEPLDGTFDLVITESTYGNAKHGPIGEVGPQLLDAVKECIRNQSRLLVPSFAVGRTQTILWYMQRFIASGDIPAIPIFIDSPMGVQASEAYSEFRDSYDAETNGMIGTRDLFGLSKVTFASSGEESRRINEVRGAAVIIASSPTCEFGAHFASPEV